MRRLVVHVFLALLVLTPVEARSLGVFEDVAEEAGFLYVRHQTSLGASLIRTNGGHPDASVFSLSASFPVRRNVLVRVEQPFIALIGENGTASGFGDALVRARLDMSSGEGRAFRLLSSVRLGSGTSNLFPYSSQSIDLSLGAAFVDSLDTVHFWVSAEGIVVKRAPSGLSDQTRHEDSIRLGGGIGVDIAGHVGLCAGGTAQAFRSGGGRQMLFSQVGYFRSPALELFVAAVVEVGEGAYRVGDTAVTAGIHTYF